jgi:hypothetical protein
VASTLDHLGAAIMGAMASPLTGADGNVEFLIHARLASATAPAAATNDPAPLLRVALREATAR